jgi:hypothetical protein
MVGKEMVEAQLCLDADKECNLSSLLCHLQLSKFYTCDKCCSKANISRQGQYMSGAALQGDNEEGWAVGNKTLSSPTCSTCCRCHPVTCQTRQHMAVGGVSFGSEAVCCQGPTQVRSYSTCLHLRIQDSPFLRKQLHSSWWTTGAP